MIVSIQLTKNAQNDLLKAPFHIENKLLLWVDAVEKFGIHAIRRLPGFYDEPLKGSRIGQRSIRLNRAYRAIYVETISKQIHIVKIIEVNKHDY